VSCLSTGEVYQRAVLKNVIVFIVKYGLETNKKKT